MKCNENCNKSCGIHPLIVWFGTRGAAKNTIIIGSNQSRRNGRSHQHSKMTRSKTEKGKRSHNGTGARKFMGSGRSVHIRVISIKVGVIDEVGIDLSRHKRSTGGKKGTAKTTNRHIGIQGITC